MPLKKEMNSDSNFWNQCFMLRTFLLLAIFSRSFVYLHALPPPIFVDAGANTGVCPNDSATIGGNPAATGGTAPYTYSWMPVTGLDNPNSSNPKAAPSAPTTYTLTVVDALGNSSVDVVVVSIYTLPTVNAGPDQTIIQGTNIMLQGSGAVYYYWSPYQTLTFETTSTPFAEPQITTNYCMAGADANGCVNYDCAVVYVIPSDTIIVYNAFTPNKDGSNDVFYIGNLEQFPDNKLEVYNRNGKLVYKASPYDNTWEGKAEGTELPCATYYYIFDPRKDGKEKINGSVTIIR